jgi:hypothetical protein
MAERVLLWTVHDPRGLTISLAEDGWQEILQKHSELETYLDQVRLTGQDPDEIYFDPEVTAMKTTGTRAYLYYKRNLTTGVYSREMIAVAIKVIIESGDERGYVSTAFFTRHIPKRLVLEWKK